MWHKRTRRKARRRFSLGDARGEEMIQGNRTPEPFTGKRNVLVQLCALAGMMGPLLFILGFTLAGWLTPGYSPLQESISSLGVEGPHPWIQNTNFVVFGLLLLAFALGFFQQ